MTNVTEEGIGASPDVSLEADGRIRLSVSTPGGIMKMWVAMPPKVARDLISRLEIVTEASEKLKRSDAAEESEDESPWETEAAESVCGLLDNADWEAGRVVFHGLRGGNDPRDVRNCLSVEDLAVAMVETHVDGWMGAVPMESGAPVFRDPFDLLAAYALLIIKYQDRLDRTGWKVPE